MTNNAIKFKKGSYYIGDPCYLFDKSWGDVLHETDFFNQPFKGECKFKGKVVAGGATAYGDGVYQDKEGKEYWVDSGMLAILPISLEKIDGKFREGRPFKEQGAHIVKFDSDFDVEISDGIFTFGHIIIDTKNDSEEEEED